MTKNQRNYHNPVEQNRFKSKPAFIAVSTLIFVILKTWGLFEPLGLTPESYQELSIAVLGVVSIFAYYNNPKDKRRY